jgi:hypothetical protein
LSSKKSYSFIGFAAAAFLTAIVSLIIIGIVAGSTSVSGNGVVIQQDALNALPINVVGTASVDYNITSRSGGNVSVYLIDQDQLVPLEKGETFPSYPLFNCENVNHAAKSGNLTSGQYYLVILNGLSVTSTGPVTVDYHMDIGGQTSNMSLIGWIWSAIALAAAVAMGIGIVRLTRGKQTKKVTLKRSKNSTESRRQLKQ